jgi:hypothetical protein
MLLQGDGEQTAQLGLSGGVLLDLGAQEDDLLAAGVEGGLESTRVHPWVVMRVPVGGRVRRWVDGGTRVHVQDHIPLPVPLEPLNALASLEPLPQGVGPDTQARSGDLQRDCRRLDHRPPPSTRAASLVHPWVPSMVERGWTHEGYGRATE